MKMKYELKETNSRLTKLKIANVNLQQFVRRNNIEIHRIPDEEIEDLESKVVSIAASIGIVIRKTEIEACHRLKKGQKTDTREL